MKKGRKYFIGFWLLLLLLVEWLAELILKIVTVVHGSIKDLTIALNKKYKEVNEPDSGNVSDQS